MEDVDKFIRGQVAKRTVEGNVYAVSTFSRFMREHCSDERDIETITPVELDTLLCRMFMSIKKITYIYTCIVFLRTSRILIIEVNDLAGTSE